MQYLYWVIEGQLAGRPGPEKLPWNLHRLKAEGIGGVVSLDGPIETWPLEMAQIEHLPAYQPMIWLDQEPIREQFLDKMPEILDFYDRFRKRPEGILVHCHHGCDRTGTILACCLVAREGLSAEEAVSHVREANPLALVAFGYPEAVTTFEKLIREDPEKYGMHRTRMKDEG